MPGFQNNNWLGKSPKSVKNGLFDNFMRCNTGRLISFQIPDKVKFDNSSHFACFLVLVSKIGQMHKFVYHV